MWRELHDSVSQRLFSMVYEARAAALRGRDPKTAGTLQRLEEAAGTALKEMKALVYALRPKSLERDGLEANLRDHVEALRRAHGAVIEIRVHGELCLPPREELALLEDSSRDHVPAELTAVWALESLERSMGRSWLW